MPAVGDAWSDLCWAAFESLERPVSKPERPLYHYTDVHGFEAMVRSGEFWATHVRYMSDHMEIAYGRRLLHRVLLDKASHWKPEQVETLERNLLAMSHTDARRPTPVYAVCFSEVGDDMSQWDRYAKGGLGYSIGFEPAAFDEMQRLHVPTDWNDCTLRKVIYNEAEQTKLLEQVVAQGIALVDDDLKDWSRGGDDFLTLARHMASHVLELVSTFKHPGFSAEQEWRLMYTGGIHESEGFDAMFRSSGRGMIPYVTLGVPAKPNIRQRLPISTTICGPALPRIEAPMAAAGFMLLNVYQAIPAAHLAKIRADGKKVPFGVAVSSSSMARF